MFIEPSWAVFPLIISSGRKSDSSKSEYAGIGDQGSFGLRWLKSKVVSGDVSGVGSAPSSCGILGNCLGLAPKFEMA